jgi:hypothetical protein
MNDIERLLPTLQPPAGGAARLQRALTAGGSEADLPWEPAVAALTCVALLAVAALPPTVDDTDWRPRFSAQLVQAAELRVSDGAALALPVGNPHVRVFVISRTRGSTADEPES